MFSRTLRIVGASASDKEADILIEAVGT